MTLEQGSVAFYQCRADLLPDTETIGWAEWSQWTGWACESGSGTGTVAYRPNYTDAPTYITVDLLVDPVRQTVEVWGSYIRAGTLNALVVRASFPAFCTYRTALLGWTGTVNPV